MVVFPTLFKLCTTSIAHITFFLFIYIIIIISIAHNLVVATIITVLQLRVHVTLLHPTTTHYINNKTNVLLLVSITKWHATKHETKIMIHARCFRWFKKNLSSIWLHQMWAMTSSKNLCGSLFTASKGISLDLTFIFYHSSWAYHNGVMVGQSCSLHLFGVCRMHHFFVFFSDAS